MSVRTASCERVRRSPACRLLVVMGQLARSNGPTTIAMIDLMKRALILACLVACSSSHSLPVYLDFPNTDSCANGRTLCGSGCADLLNHPDDCGACGHACSSDQVCVAGQCT